MRMRQKNSSDPGRADRQRDVGIHIRSLFHAAVDKIRQTVELDERTAARDFMRRADKCHFHE